MYRKWKAHPQLRIGLHEIEVRTWHGTRNGSTGSVTTPVSVGPSWWYKESLK
jgi:hypothetical protein